MRFPQPGEQFGRYRIERVLGQGGMGVVYAATDLRLDRLVAVKVITGPLAQNEEFLRRFHDEAAVLAQLDSPYVIAITDHDEIDGLPFIVTQHVDGTDLGSLLQHGPLPARTALTICAQVARGLGDAHRSGVVHRDIKPANILLRDAGTTDVHAYVIDFGIARSESSDGHTATGLVAGTWAYLAPERTQGQPATRASDLYALGCVLWTCLVGHEPFRGTEIEMAIAHTQAPVPQLAGTSPFVSELNTVLRRLLAKKPEDRYPDAARARADLERLAASAPDSTDAVLEAAPAPVAADPTAPRRSAAPPTVVPPLPPTRATRRWPLAAAAVAVLALVGGGIAWAVASGDDADPGSDRVPLGVTGDLDDDGFGDLLVQQNRADSLQPIRTWLARSTGKAFGSPEDGDATDGRLHLGDVDGDGLPDQVWTEAADDGTGVTVEVVPADGGQWTTDLALDPALTGDQPTVTVADLTHDGLADLVLHDETNTTGQVRIHVAAGEGDGFGAPEQVYDADAPESGLLLLDAGDFDGDGATDLVATVDGLVDGEYSKSVTLLTVGDGGDLSAGEPVEVTGLGYGFAVWLVADVDGDGADEPLLAGQRGLASLDLTAGADTEPTQVLTPDGKAATWLRGGGGAGSELWGVSDLDGDEDDDVVRLVPAESSIGTEAYEMQVHLSDGSMLDPTPDISGTLDCSQECEDAFVVVPPAR